MLGLIQNLRRQRRVSIILIVHNYNQVFEVCDRINFLHSGRIVLDASTTETSEEELIHIVKSGLERKRDRRRGGRSWLRPGMTVLHASLGGRCALYSAVPICARRSDRRVEGVESMADKTSSPLPTRPLGKTGMNITRLGLGTWAIGGPNWAFGWGAAGRRGVARHHPARAGARPELDRHRPRFMASAMPRRWWVAPCTKFRAPTGPMCSPRARWSGTSATTTFRPGASGTRPACGVRWRRRCAGSRWIASTCTRCTGRPTTRRSKSTGRRCWT